MTASGPGRPADSQPHESWASETLPLAVRRELLERELHKLGVRQRGSPAREGQPGAQQQHQPGEHPQAGAPTAADAHPPGGGGDTHGG